jgi:hypothetical protein
VPFLLHETAAVKKDPPTEEAFLRKIVSQGRVVL